MIIFTQTQKNELDALRNRDPELSLYDAMKEVRNNESLYPVLYIYLFNSNGICQNQKLFAAAWTDPSLTTIEVEKYYLLMFAGMYISLDPDNNVCFTAKDDFAKAYKKQFTQAEIDDLQDRPEFANRVALDQCKVEVSVDDENNPVKPSDDPKPVADEAVADQTVLKE